MGGGRASVAVWARSGGSKGHLLEYGRRYPLQVGAYHGVVVRGNHLVATSHRKESYDERLEPDTARFGTISHASVYPQSPAVLCKVGHRA